MGNRSKDENAAAENHSQDTRDASLAKTIAAAVAVALAQQKAEETHSIAEAVAQQTKSIMEAVSKQKSEETQALTDVFQRQMEETRAQYQELLKASCAQKLSSTLKVTSGTNGFRVMDAFDWTNDKNIYQRWQLWSHKARLALDAMEGDNEKTKISYLHHWLDGKGIDKIKGWTNSKILIPQEEYDALEERDRKGRYSSDKIESYFSLVENILTPRSNPLLAVEELHLTKQGSMTSQEFHSQILEIVKRCRFPNQAAEDRAVRDAIFIGMNSQRTKDKAINMLKVIGNTGTTSGTESLKFPIDVNPRGTYKHHLEVSIDTGADVNCMNEKTFKKLFPEVDLSVCPHSIQNFGNSTADVYILGQFRVYLKFRGRKYLNTFIVTNANDCPNILSHGAIFWMGILVPNYLEENMVKIRDMETGTSNVFQVLQDLRMQQYQGNSEPRMHRPGTTVTTTTTKQLKASETPKSYEAASQKADTATYTGNMSPIQTSFRTMPPPKPSAYGTIPTPELNTAYRRPASRTHQPHSHSELQACCMHVHQQQSKTYRMEEPPALEEVKHPHRDRTSVSRSPSTEQEVLSQFSGFSEEIEHFTRDPYTTHLRSCIQSTIYAPKIHEVNTCIDCEHSHGHMNDHQVQNTPDSLGKQFLQGKEKITCTDMENTPNMDTNTYANMDTNHIAH